MYKHFHLFLLLAAIAMFGISQTGCAWFGGEDEATAKETEEKEGTDETEEGTEESKEDEDEDEPTPAERLAELKKELAALQEAVDEAQAEIANLPAEPADEQPEEEEPKDDLEEIFAKDPGPQKYVVVQTTLQDTTGGDTPLFLRLITEDGTTYRVPPQFEATWMDESGNPLEEATNVPLPKNFEMWDTVKTTSDAFLPSAAGDRITIEPSGDIRIVRSGRYYISE